MAKTATLTTITSTNNNASTLNTNFSALNTALTNTLSRDGSTPNTMSADLDLNSNDLLNAASLNTALLYIGGNLVNSIGNLANWAGTWATSTAYDPYDIVYEETNNTIYRCLVAHTSGVFATDLSNSNWEVYIADGLVNTDAVTVIDLTVTGDLDVSSVDNLSTVRTDLGLEIGADVQAYDAVLADLAGLTLAEGDVVYFDGTNLVNLGIGTDGQVLTVNDTATAPNWEALPAAAGFSGARISREANHTAQNFSSTTEYAGWDTSNFDAGGWADIGGSNPERLTVPADVSYVELTANLRVTSTSQDVNMQIFKNGSAANIAGRPIVRVSPDAASEARVQIDSGPVNVSENDYFTLAIQCTDTSVDLSGAFCWFAIKAVG